MNVRMTARHFDLSEGTKRHIQERSEHFERFFNNIIDLHWVLEMDKRRHTAETSARVFGALLTGKGEGADLRSAIDLAADKMETQLKKYKGRLKDKDPKAIAEAKEAAAASELGAAETEGEAGEY